jgi:excisionase family DNA binding protein
MQKRTLAHKKNGEESMFDELDKLYTTQEVSKILRVSLQTVGNWLRSGKIKGSKVGKGWRIKKSELERFMNDQQEQEV